MLASELQSPLPPPVRTGRSQGGGHGRLRCHLGAVMAPLKVLRLTVPFRVVGLGLGAGTLSPGRDWGEGLPSAARGFVQGGGDNGGGGGAGIAGCQGSGTSCPSALQRNPIRGAGPGRGGGAPAAFGLQCVFTVI